jgi:hypothetical protein
MAGSGVKVGELYSVLRLDRGGFDQAVRGAGTSVTGLSSKFDTLIKKPGLFGAAMKGLGIGAGISLFGLLERGIHSAVEAFGDAIDAAKEEQVAQSALQTALRANVAAYDGNLESINRVIDARLRLGFTDNEQAESLAVLVAMTKDSTAALDIQRTAMDLARLKHMDLAAASVILGKAYNGNFIALKRLGIQVEAGTTGIEALGLVQRRVAGQAEAFGKTEEGAAAGAAAEWEKFQEDLGNLLLPALTAVMQALRDDVIPALRDTLPIIVDISGAVLNVAKLAVPALVAILAIRLVGAFRLAAAEGVASATAIKLAWQGALLGIPAIFEFIREKQEEQARNTKGPSLPFDWLLGTSLEQAAAGAAAGTAVSDGWMSGWMDGTSARDRALATWAAEIPEELQKAAEEANAVVSASAAGFAAVLEDGSTIFAGSAQVLADELPHAMSDAKARAEAEAAKVPRGLADAILGSIDDLDGIRKAITDAIAGAVTDAKAIAEGEAILAGKDVTSGFKKGSTELDVALLDSLDAVITSLNILAPAALTTGEGIPPALKEGIEKNLGLMVDAIKRIHDSVGSHLDLGDFARQMGYDGLADYIDGMGDADAPGAARRTRTAIQTEMELNLFGAGRRAAFSWLNGFATTGYSQATGWLDGLKQLLVGNSPPPEGPLKDLDIGAERAAQSWVDAFTATLRAGSIQPALAAFIPGTGAPTLAAAAAGGSGPLLGSQRPPAGGTTQVTIQHMELNGIGDDVSPAAARGFAQDILDIVGNGIQEESSRFPARPGIG